MTPLKFTPEVIQIIRDNYPQYGKERCLEILGGNFCANGIQQVAIKNKIYRIKPYEGENCNVDSFKNVTDPKVAYFLGWLWADGYIVKKKGKAKAINFCVRQDDGREFYEMIKDLGYITINHRDADKYNRVYINLCNAKLAEYLGEKDYMVKSKVSPTKILETIPESLRPLFWRGFFCGDGSITITQDKKEVFTPSLVFCGAIDQDWSDLEKVCNMLNFSSSISRYTRSSTGHKGSKLQINSRHEMVSLLSWIYKSFEEDHLGLVRKFEKFQILKEHNTQMRENAKNRIILETNGLFSFKFGRLGFSAKKNWFKTWDDAAIFHDLVYVLVNGIRCYTIFNIENYFPERLILDKDDHAAFLKGKYGNVVDTALEISRGIPISIPKPKTGRERIRMKKSTTLPQQSQNPHTWPALAIPTTSPPAPSGL